MRIELELDASTKAVLHEVQLNWDRTPPVLTFNNPAVANSVTTVAKPYLQIQGSANKDLASLSYDINNANGVFTDQDVSVVDRSLDTNTMDFSTNTFQAYDVPLAVGDNHITLRMSDRAGNTTTTNFNAVLDYSAATTPPLVQCLWPTNGMQIIGSTVTLRGQVDDPTATVTATVTGANGDTSTVSGYVEPNGRFWVENLPLNGGTNIVSITLNNAVNLSTTITISLVQSALTLTINPLADASQLWQPTVSVSGTVTAGYGVWVNGVAATHYTNNGDGTSTWSADNVPVPPGGVAAFDLTAYPPGEMPPGGSSGNGINPQTPDAGNAPVESDKPSELYVQSSTVSNSVYTDYKDVGVVTGTGAADLYLDIQYLNINDFHALTNGTGGPGFARTVYQWDEWDGPWTPTNSECSSQTTWITWTNFSVLFSTFSTPGFAIISNSFYSNFGDVGDTGVTTNDNYGPLAIYDEHCVLPHFEQDEPPVVYPGTGYQYGDTLTYTYKQISSRLAQTKWQLNTGGKAGRQSLWRLSGWATKKDLVSNQAPDIPAGQISIKGRALGADGNLWLMLPDGMENLDVTPVVNDVDYYWFGVNTQKYTPYINLTTATTNADLSTNVPEVCVGQLVNFSLKWSPGAPSGVIATDTLQHWTLPANFVNQKSVYWNGSPECDIYITNWNLLINTNSVNCWYVNGKGGTVGTWQSLHFANGQYASIAAVGNFTVFRPKVNWNGIITGSIASDMDYHPAGNNPPGNPGGPNIESWLHFGGSSNGIHGIIFTKDNFNSGGHGGTNFPVQLLKTSDELQSCQTNGNSIHYSGQGLDLSYPYNSYDGANYYDEPGWAAHVDEHKASANTSYQMFLMFDPETPGSIAVPLRLVAWNWSASANRLTTNQWTLSSSNATVAANNQDTLFFPTWTNTIKALADYISITNNNCK